MKNALPNLAALALALAVVAPARPAGADTYSWDLSTVDAAANSGNSLALRVEPAGIGHVAFWTIGLGVRYGTGSGASWTLETLPDAGVPPGGPGIVNSPAPPDETQLILHTSVSLAIAADGSPWIAEIDHGSLSSHSDAGPLAVRHREAGTWVTEWLGVSGSRAALEIDAAGGVHAAWSTYGGDVVYARRVGANAWTSEIAISPAGPPVMKVAADGTVHLALVQGGTVQHLARAPGGGWTVTPVAAPAIFGFIGPTDLDLDPADHPVVLTLERDPLYPRTHLRLHRQAGTAWAHEDVDVDETEKEMAGLAFDGAGNPVVAYRRLDGEHFVVSVPGPTGWAWTEVDPFTNGSQGVDAQVDGMGRPWLASAAPQVGVRLAIGQRTIDAPPMAEKVPSLRFGLVSPSPLVSGGEVRFTLAVPEAGSLELGTYDARGALLERESRPVVAGWNVLRLATRSLAPGIYWLRVRDTAGRADARRFVIAG